MKSTRKLSRRSFLGRVVGGAVAGGGAFVALTSAAEAQVSDNDTGTNSDPAGRGRGVSDNDSGQNSDPPGRGRGARRAACSDNDSGSNSDPSGRGRGTGRSDSDPTDAVNCGRR